MAPREPSGLPAGHSGHRGRSLGGGRGPTGSLCGGGHEAAAAGLGPGRLQPRAARGGLGRAPGSRSPAGGRPAAHHARQAPALPGTRGRLLWEILPVRLQHCLLGERGVGFRALSCGLRDGRFSALLGGDHTPYKGLGPYPYSFLPFRAPRPPPRPPEGGLERLRVQGVGWGREASWCLPKARWRKGRFFLDGPRGKIGAGHPLSRPAHLLCWGVGCARSSTPYLAATEQSCGARRAESAPPPLLPLQHLGLRPPLKLLQRWVGQTCTLPVPH